MDEQLVIYHGAISASEYLQVFVIRAKKRQKAARFTWLRSGLHAHEARTAENNKKPTDELT